ncbi:TPA: carbohydrate binding domain-containing protein [Klebsiella pneumoniae]|nr:carbohydrate binding domain-containing protein [Klebsiella pneumoniae]
MANNIIKGRKGGGSKQRTPTEQPDDLQSVAKAKILLALGEGEFAGGLTGKDIYLDGTPLENADGSQNFSGVSWEFRPGTQAQTYIQGIPGTENEISVGTEVSSKTAWTHTFTNTQLSAVRVRLKWPSLMKQEDDGDVVGNTVKYAIDLQTDGGAWQTVLETAVTGKTTSGYERSHRIDLPQAGSTWTLRLRKISPDANSVKVGDVMTLQSYTEVIDAKLRYPNTALLYIEFDSSQFNGSIPQISCEPRGRVIRVPDNYNPETREYTGVWTGGFKWAWTDNPAWIYYDIVIADRFGLGNRLSSANISKWTLYQIAQYCDQLVPDGRGGDGMEPRYTCNVYVQERNDAYTVLRDFAAIFRGMTCWNGEQIVVQADMPRDVDFTYTRANIVGKPRYSSSSSQVRYTNALVSWSDPDNAYADAMEPAFIPELVSRYSFNQLEMTAIGCTRQSEAHRKGLWGILTNNKDRMVEIDVGLDGRIPQPGYIIALADELLAGRVNGGRISAVNGQVITLDRDVDAKPGDRLQLNLPSGISQSRTIQAVNGRRQITVTTVYSETPERECVWAIESDDLFLQQYRVTGVKENSDATLTITGVAHDPDKFPRIDTGAIIDQRPVSVLPAGNQSPPDDIVITSRSVVNQGISVETMQVNWSAVSGAIAYEAQWRRNDGNWINVPRSSTTSFEVSGIYAGRYLVRVRAINAAEISSGWAYSEEKTLTGKVGEPLAPLALATRSLVHGVQVSWEFPTGSGDTLRTELQYSKNQDGSAPMPLSDVAYPGKSYQQMGLSMGAEFWYRARLVDRLGNESPWTGWVQGMASDNFDDYYENLTDAIKDTAAWEETQRTISETQEGIRNTQQELEQTAEALRKEAEDQAKQVSQDIDASAKSITADVDGKISAVNKTITDEITSVNEALDSGLAQANKGVQEAKSAVADANKQIATVNKSLTDSITQVRQSVTDTAAEINATIDLEISRVSKTLADGDAALNAQIKTAENGLKQSLSQVNTTLTNAVKQETADRIADVNAKAAQAADELLAATQGIEASIESLTQVMKTADENLAREMSSLAAGANIQFDSQVIWHFNNQTTEGWTGSAGVPGVSQDGWLRPADSATDPYITSPGGLAVDGAAYRFIMLRFRKTGKPVWAGEIRWVSAGENFNNTKRYIVAEPEYADGVATLTVRDIPWTGNIDRIRLDLTNQQDASNFIEFDWIAVGRPAPGASTAALQDVRSTLSNALTAEAQARSTLAAQMRGSYDGNDLEKVTSGLLYQEKTARVTAISAEVKARESLQTQFNDNKAAVSGELSSLTTEQSAQASRIGGLETSLGKKADAAALTSLTQKVEQQGATLTSQGAALTSLTNRVGQTETGLAGTNEALSGLQSVVTQQGDRITSQGQSITKLTSDLGTTNTALAKKAEAAAVTALTQQVEQNGRDIRSNTDSITSLSNQLVNGQPNRWSRRLYPVQLANAGTVPSFSDVRAVAPTVVDEVADAAKLDFTSAGSYLIALYSCQVKVAADTTITLAPGARVFDDTGAIFVNGVQVAWGNASWNTVSFELKAGWNTVEFLVNQWTGQAYINLGLKLSDKVAEMYSGLGVSALANAAGVLSSNVSQIGNDLTAANSAITKLTGNLANTDKALAQKADATALATLDTKVTQQGKTLESQSNSLTNLSNSLSQVAADIDASGQIPGNLVVNPSFERGLDGYTGRSTATSVVEVSVPHSGTRALKVDPGSVSPGQYIPFVQGRTYEIGVWVKEPGATTDNGVGNNKLRIGNSAGQPVFERPYNSGTVGTNWTLVSGRWKATETASLPVTLSNYLISGSRYFDDFYVTDVTDRVEIDATAGAVTGLTSRVSTAEGAITSQSQQLTNLQNSLNTTNSNVSKKADATALTSVDNRVTEAEGKLTTQSQQLTNLANVLTATRNAGDNLIPNFDFLQGSTAWDIQYPAGVTFGDFGDGKAGVRLNRTTTTSPGIFSNNNKPVPLNGQRKYRVVVKAKGVSGAMSLLIRRQNKIGQTDSTYEDKTVTLTTDWQTITWETGLTAAGADGQNFKLYSHPTNGEIWLDSVRVFDITDVTNIKATSDAVSSLTGTVTNQGNTLTSQGQSITALNNALEGVKGDVAKKADASAVSSLTNRVTQTEKDIRSQADSLTSLNTSLKQQATRGANVLPDGSFESYAVGDVLSNARAVITSEAAHSGTKSLRVTRSTEYNPNATDNNDTHIFSGMQVRDNAVYYVEAWVKLPAGSTADPTVYMVLGFSFQDSANGWSWPGLNVKVSELSVDNWTKVSGYLTNNRTALKQAMVRISIPNTPKVRLGDAFLIDDLIITDVTDAKAALDAADANAQALSSLSASVTQNGKNITSQGSAITKLQSDVTQLGKDISGKADASALTNLTTRVTATEGGLKSQGDSLTSLQNSLNTTNSNVAKKADATALQSLQNTVEQHGRDLTTQSSALTNLENNFSSLAVGGTNLIRNADTLEGWSSRHATETYLGDRVAYTRLAKGASGYTQLDEQTLDVTGRTEFVFSFYAKGAYNGQEMASYFYNPSNTTTTETSQGVKGGAGDGKAVTKLTTAWARYWVKWVIPATSGTKRLIAARLESATSADKEVWLCRPQLETGTVMTDWSPSPDDAASGITANTSAINSLTSRVTNAEGQLTAQSQSITNLQNSLNTTNNNVAQKASAQSVSDLTSRVTSAEGKITSQGQAITKLQGDLSSTTDKVNTKADQTALNALTGRVEKTEAGLTAANSNIVSLTAAVNAGNAAGDDYIPNPSFDPAYDRMGYDVVETTAAGVPADCPFRYAVRLAGRDHVPKINNIAVTPGDVYEMSALVACGTGSADFNFYIGRATTATGGIGARASGGNTKTTTAWKRATWRFTVPADTNFLRPFLQVNQSSPFGTVWYAADWHMRNVTAANSAQKTADATAKAVDSLTTTVSQQGDTLSSIGTRTTSLENSLRSTNDTVSKKADTTAVTQLQGTVTQQGNDIAAANSALTKLSSDLATTNANVNKKADASAMNTLQNQVTEQGKTLSAQGDSLTQLSNSLSQTAADIDASGKMPGNLIVNGSFERGAAGFTGWSSTATVADLQVPHSGNKALKMSAGQSNLVGQEISITQGRTYRMGVWAKQDPGTTIKDAGNTKFRVADSTGLLVGSNYGPFSSGWQLVTFDWKATKTTTASFQLTTFLSAGAMYFDDFHVLDVTDEKDIAANAGAISQMNTRVTAAEGAITTQAQQLTKLSGDLAVTNAAVSQKAEQSAVTGLTTRMTSAEGKLDSQSQQLTSLQNSLTTMNTELGKKADTSAVSSLTGRVSQVENTITSQSQSITSLTSTINTIRTQGANPWVDGTFESYSDGQVLGGNGTAVVVASQKFTGDKSLKLRRDENNGGNSDKQLGTWQSVREDAKFRFEFWAMMPADQAPSSGWTTLVGIQSQNAAGQNAWQAAVTVSEASLGARDKWVKFTGIASNNGAGRTRAVVWISTRGATGNGTPGYSLYIDDLVITDVTDAKAAQDASDATASAVSGLTARVTDAEGKITAQAQQQTALATKVDNANSRVDNMAKTLSDSQSTQVSLNTSLQSQIDAQAAANIKNQTTLDNTIKSVASITSTQQTHATALEALATQQTTLTSSVGDLSASVQNTAKTVADVNGTVSSLWSMKVETVNGKNVGAGITLGSNGETSDMILYADRFSLFNRNNATAVPVMIAEGNELYIDTARIKNSSLTSTKIADGSITNAKIGKEIRSDDFVDGARGWSINKDGGAQFNNGIFRGHIEAASGKFKGTLEAQSFIGDIAVARRYDDMAFRRNQTVQRNGAYQNRGYGMTIVLSCTLVYQLTGAGNVQQSYSVDITFNIGGQEVTRRFFANAGGFQSGDFTQEFRFAADLLADNNNVSFFIKARGNDASIDYSCSIQNITATAFRTNSNSFS